MTNIVADVIDGRDAAGFEYIARGISQIWAQGNQVEQITALAHRIVKITGAEVVHGA